MSLQRDFAYLVSSLASFGATRAKLFSLELAQEKTRVVSTIVLGVVAFLFAVFAVLALSVAVVVYFWDTPYRHTAVWVMFFVYLLISAISIICMRRGSFSENPPFKFTVATLKDDLAAFRSNRPTEAVVVTSEYQTGDEREPHA